MRAVARVQLASSALNMHSPQPSPSRHSMISENVERTSDVAERGSGAFSGCLQKRTHRRVACVSAERLDEAPLVAMAAMRTPDCGISDRYHVVRPPRFQRSGTTRGHSGHVLGVLGTAGTPPISCDLQGASAQQSRPLGGLWLDRREGVSRIRDPAIRRRALPPAVARAPGTAAS